MKKLIILAATIAAISGAASAGNVNGYYKKDGTYVQPHYRTAPDGNPYNNYGCSYNGNCD